MGKPVTYIIRLEVPDGTEPDEAASFVANTVRKMTMRNPIVVDDYDNAKFRVATIRAGREHEVDPLVITDSHEIKAAEIILGMSVERRAQLRVSLATALDASAAMQLAERRAEEVTVATVAAVDDSYRSAIISELGNDAYRRVMRVLV